jgi:hypothetical protein
MGSSGARLMLLAIGTYPDSVTFWVGGKQMAYEPDMTIIFDVTSKGVAVSFRGKAIYLPGPYLDRKAGVAAGEALCRKLGWLDV